MYSLNQYGHMIRDSVRMQAYTEALRRAVRPGDVVVDMGAGTGILALMACQFGARHVYAIETNPLILTGRDMASANGFADRITFIRSMVQQAELPEKVDLVMGDLRGRLPISEVITSAFGYARAHFMKPDARFLPQKDILYAAPIGYAEKWEDEILRPWVHNPMGLSLHTVMPMLTNSVLPDPVETPDCVLTPQVWSTLDYVAARDEKRPDAMTWAIDEPVTLHFIAVWFDAVLYEDAGDSVGYSNAPGVRAPQVHQRILLPFSRPLELNRGDTLAIRLTADPYTDDHNFRWHTSVTSEAASMPREEFKQNTFYSQPLVDIHKRGTRFVPTLKPGGRTLGRALALMDNGRSLADVAAQLAAEFPGSFVDSAAALAFVADLSQRYSD
ncbi:MAG: 50S ribosomal protein L11 methyltransferase [Chloroflexi bacterium]|nr:50S ribosomal protein L11 methyltransferase [Chloroflexota bacterium]